MGYFIRAETEPILESLPILSVNGIVSSSRPTQSPSRPEVTPNNGASTNPFSALLGSGKMCSDTPPVARLQRMKTTLFPTKLGI